MSVPVSKKRKEVHREPSNSQVRWKQLELLGVLTYLNDNFGLWQENHLKACNVAIRETNINRDEKSLYNKINSMFKAMEDYQKEGKKSTAWEEGSKVFDLVKEMYEKAKEGKESKKAIIDDDTEMTINDDQATNEMLAAINKLCDEKRNLISQNQTMIIKKIEEANDIFEKTNVQMFYSAERARNICNEKLDKIAQLQTELIELMRVVNNKYEELKDLQ